MKNIKSNLVGSRAFHHGKVIAQFEKARFLAVGALNTMIDFALLNLFAGLLHMPIISANIISTSISLIFSFYMNKRTVFRSTSKNRKTQFVLFVVVTLVGVWILQSIVITHFYGWLEGVLHAHDASRWHRWVILNGAKALATIVSAVWNYMWYSKLVFKDRPSQ